MIPSARGIAVDQQPSLATRKAPIGVLREGLKRAAEQRELLWRPAAVVRLSFHEAILSHLMANEYQHRPDSPVPPVELTKNRPFAPLQAEVAELRYANRISRGKPLDVAEGPGTS